MINSEIKILIIGFICSEIKEENLNISRNQKDFIADVS